MLNLFVIYHCILQDGMVYHHEVLEHGDFASRQQVVRWLRRFPFAFLSDRDYCLARREFKEDDGSIYGISKVRGAQIVFVAAVLLLKPCCVAVRLL